MSTYVTRDRTNLAEKIHMIKHNQINFSLSVQFVGFRKAHLTVQPV